MVRQSARQAAQAKPAIVKEERSPEQKKKPTPAKKSATSKRKANSTEENVDQDIEHADAVVKEDKTEEEEGDKDQGRGSQTAKPAPKKRKVASKEEENSMPLAPRTAITALKRAMYIGAHVSGAGGVQNAIQNATNVGANAFALFLKSQRKWTSPPLADEAKTQWHALLKKDPSTSYDPTKHVLPHGSYLVNLAQADPAKADQAYDNFLDDLQRCESLNIGLYNFHPGSTGGAPMPDACRRIASQLNKAHRATKSVVTVIENMCGSGNVVGSRFEELRDIIASVDDKSRVGVCIDTCHAFAAGYDLRTPEAFAKTIKEFDDVVGLKYLRAFHLNDSKAPFGSHRDLHANIGTGFLGLRAFHNIMNHAALQNLPMVLETPIEEMGPNGKMVENKQIWADEIKLLESLIGMDADSDDFGVMEVELQSKGKSERDKIQDQVDKKAVKDAKKSSKAVKVAKVKVTKVTTTTKWRPQ
ncbi:xylose isomerase-like protein [Cladorrhinum samala]|uniref:Apurinic-apyrimidinic endonuclease 1 n=1 Tax=Cladorrhinum samala TaxID=585594 RepID=A0AAV9HEX4_9PEZI|nr:xylose isomerase-like protein [Cladorrhinum samala]